jgi:hypothetical protein
VKESIRKLVDELAEAIGEDSRAHEALDALTDAILPPPGNVTPIGTEPPQEKEPLYQNLKFADGTAGKEPSANMAWDGLRGVCTALAELDGCAEDLGRFMALASAAKALCELLEERRC